ncbi:MAG: hypothetical protein U1E84_16670 [Rhodoferax sp.]|mgnify:FL=1
METPTQILLELAQSLDSLRDDLMRLSLAIEDVAFIVNSEQRTRALDQVHELLERVAVTQSDKGSG